MMGWLWFIGAAFLCGVAFAAFLAPLVVLVWWFDKPATPDSDRKEGA